MMLYRLILFLFLSSFSFTLPVIAFSRVSQVSKLALKQGKHTSIGSIHSPCSIHLVLA